jgi:hypothetical protein
LGPTEGVSLSSARKLISFSVDEFDRRQQSGNLPRGGVAFALAPFVVSF